MARKYDWRRIKKHFSYDIGEAAKALTCSVATIRGWIKQGLPVMADQKPFLIDGRDLSAFARHKSEALKWHIPKSNAPWNYFPCFHCKGYRKPYLLMADYIPKTPEKGRLAGICEDCDGTLMKYCTTTQLPQFSTTLHVTHQLGANTLNDPDTP